MKKKMLMKSKFMANAIVDCNKLNNIINTHTTKK